MGSAGKAAGTGGFGKGGKHQQQKPNSGVKAEAAGTDCSLSEIWLGRGGNQVL